MSRTEYETRVQLIDPKLRRAGWEVLTDKNVIQKNAACIEIEVDGMPRGSETPSGRGFADYVLFGEDGKPLAVIEAKKGVLNAEYGRAQACLYADCLEKKYGVRPVIYYTNGYSITIIDGIYPARTVFGFHRKEELEYIIQKRNYKLIDTVPNQKICGRYYQMDAIAEIIKHLEKHKSRSLIVLATGTGKTRTACGLSELFIRNNYVKRILFLADRKNLVTQAHEDTFAEYLPDVPMCRILEGKTYGSPDARIVFSTYQSMLALIKDTSKSPYGIGHFDLIIVDEAHRSLFNRYAEIFSYFDSIMVGLTATPRNDIHKSTYKVFNLDTDAPNYEYDLVKAVQDGYLTHFRALDRTPEMLRNGLKYEDLSEEDKEQYEETFMDEDGEVPEKIEGKAFASYINNRGTIKAVLQMLMDEGLRVDNGNQLGKTIIFAKNHKHAMLIQDVFREMYPELCLTDGKNGVDYCVVIDNQIKHNDHLQREFKTKDDIRIVVSVDMMDTGVDIPAVVNLVFFKRVASKIKFWQMIGRGTRLCKDLHVISPSKAYFNRETNDKSRQLYKDKQGFLIFDVCDVFNFFKLNPDGKAESSVDDLSLNQALFVQKTALYKEMMKNEHTLSPDDLLFAKSLQFDLSEQIRNANPNYIGVEKNYQYFEKYSDDTQWDAIGQNELTEIKKYIAPNIVGDIDLPECLRFDLLMNAFSTAKLSGDSRTGTLLGLLYYISKHLTDKKSHIKVVRDKLPELQNMQTDDFSKSSPIEIENLRLKLRDLMRYVEKDFWEPIETDFKDIILSTGDAPDVSGMQSFSTEDFRKLDEKVISYINNNPNNALINKIANLQSYILDDFIEFRDIVIKLSKNENEFKDMFGDNIALISFVRSHVNVNPSVIDTFANRYEEFGYDFNQIAYIKELVKYVLQNGYFYRSDLVQREELAFSHLFSSSVDILRIANDLEQLDYVLR